MGCASAMPPGDTVSLACDKEHTVGELRGKLIAQDKTIAVLKRQLLQRDESADTPFALLEQNSNLARVVALKTQELETEREELRKALDELHHTQLRLLQAEKMESIGQLAAGIAHEINTPTQYVSDNVAFVHSACASLFELIDACMTVAEAARASPAGADALAAFDAALKRAKLDFLRSQIPDALEQSLEGLRRVAHIVSAMKDFSHPSCGEKEAIDLGELIDTATTVARNEWKYVAELSTEIDPALPLVPCLRNEISQVILNLVVNAAHAIADSLEAGVRERGSIRISAKPVRDCAEIRVTDDGTGIKDDIQKKIFDPFFTTKPVGKGTGQGLAIVYSAVVDKHGGEVSCETKVRSGTTFIVRLPLSSDKIEAPACE